jgi:hypothetical protein
VMPWSDGEGKAHGAYVEAGIDHAERYGAFVHGIVSAEFEARRAMSPVLPCTPTVPTGSMWAAVAEATADVEQNARVVDAAAAGAIAENADSLGGALPADIVHPA